MVNTQQGGTQAPQDTPATANQNRFIKNIVIKLAPNSRTGWIILILILLILFSAWLFNWFGIRNTLNNYRVTILGLFMTIALIIFIFYGFIPRENDESRTAKIFIALALSIWMLDLIPANFFLIGPWLGAPWRGYDLPVQGLLKIGVIPIFLSGIFFALLYLDMVLNIIEKKYVSFFLSFVLILILNYFLNFLSNYFPFLKLNFFVTLPKWSTIIYGLLYILGFAFLGLLMWKLDKRRGNAIPDFFTYLYMIFVFSFFWINTGWQASPRAWIHAAYILFFGFGYIKAKEEGNPAAWHIWIPTLLILDFFGYSILYNSNIVFLKFIPPVTAIVIAYCYEKEVEEGNKEVTYPVAAMVLLVTFILVLSINVVGVEGGNTFAFTPIKGNTYKDLFSQLADKFRNSIESRLDIATGGLYTGAVEKNRYESLGVYFSNIRAADPRFYTTESITVWGSIRSKTYKDAVIINFSCYRWKDNNNNKIKINADRINPDKKFPIFTLEEVDTECVFNPAPANEESKKIQAGANTITFSAEYNFATDAYIKAYFMDRDRFREYTRENLEPLAELKIQDRNPEAKYTNGPVGIGMGAGQSPITVSEGYIIKPSIGITLTNRQEIQDKDKKIIQRWDGKIKNITELVLLVPPGIEIKGDDGSSINDACNKENFKLGKCPCSMPFVKYEKKDCENSCEDNILKACVAVCIESFKDLGNTGNIDDYSFGAIKNYKNERSNCINECSASNDNCRNECNFLFKTDDEKGSYTGYALDVGSPELRNFQGKDLNKDIDKHRSFVCRFTPTRDVLDNSPITTKYFRARARYNYLLENSVIVNVEETPKEAMERSPEDFYNVKDFIYWQEISGSGFSGDVLSAISLLESRWKHCCSVSGQNHGNNCKASTDTSCEADRVLMSYDDSSVGIMQINKINEGLAASVCKSGQTIYDKECNIRVGIKLLSDYLNRYKDGIQATTLNRFCPKNEQPARYQQYSEYRGIKAALRAYNGLGCRPEASCRRACSNSKNPSSCEKNCVDGTINYVEKILDKANKIKDGAILDTSGIRNIVSSQDVQEIHEDSTSTDTTNPTSTQTIQPTSQGPIEVPPPPIFVEANYDTITNTVKVSWTKSPNPDVDNYNVQREYGGKKVYLCAPLPAASDKDKYDCTDHNTDKGLKPGEKYTYIVTAYKKGQQDSVNSVDVTVPAT